jgi:hypothetical protein
MSARKSAQKRKAGTPRATSLARGFVVVLEDMRSQFKVFGEALQIVNEKVDRLDRHVTSGFERVDRELGLVKAVVLEHGRELRELKAVALDHGRELLDHGRELRELKAIVLDHGRELLDHGRELREVRGGVTRLEAAMEKKVDRDEAEAIAERVIDRRRAR